MLGFLGWVEAALVVDPAGTGSRADAAVLVEADTPKYPCRDAVGTPFGMAPVAVDLSFDLQ